MLVVLASICNLSENKYIKMCRMIGTNGVVLSQSVRKRHHLSQ